MIKVADYVIKYLANCGIKEIFVVYGAANGDLIDAFTREERIEYIAVMHEQAGGFMAEAYSKVTQNFGVALATSGPGGMNFVTPIGNCFYDSVPCLFITGQVSTNLLRSSEEVRQVGFQETDIVSTVKLITKYASMITKAEDVRYELEKAIYLMKEGRPGPVLLDLPINIQKQEIDEEKLAGFDGKHSFIDHNEDNTTEVIRGILEDLKTSKRPIILVGGGVGRECSPLLEEISKKLQIPVIPTWNALDISTSDFINYGGNVGTYGGKGRNFAIQNCDLLVAIGTRISGRITGGNPSSFARGAKKYLINIDKSSLQLKFQEVIFDVNLYCDSYEFLSRFNSLSLANNYLWEKNDFSNWVNYVCYCRDKYDPVKEYLSEKATFNPDIINPYLFVRELSNILPSNSIIITDCGGNLVIMNQAFEVKRGQRFFSSNGNSPMGFSFAAAIGAWFASDKKQPVVCVIGDGGMNVNIQELQTIINYRVNIKVIILNNHIYGITKAFQETNFEGRSEACGPKGYNPPDFVEICNAYNVDSIRILNFRNIVNRLREEVLDKPHTVICDVVCHDWHQYEPKIHDWRSSIEDMTPLLPIEELEKNMIIPLLDFSYLRRGLKISKIES